MYDSTTSFCEYVIKLSKSRLNRRRIMFCALYALLLFAAFAGFCLIWLNEPELATNLIIPYFAIIAILMALLIVLTRRYINIEYEYTIFGDEFSIAKIFGGRSRKSLFKLKISSLILVAPAANEAYRAQIEQYAPDETYSHTQYPNSEYTYFALFENENERRCLLFFDAVPDAVTALRRANPSAVKTK